MIFLFLQCVSPVIIVYIIINIGYWTDVGLKFERAVMKMIRWMCGDSIKDKRMSEELSLSQLSLEVVG